MDMDILALTDSELNNLLNSRKTQEVEDLHMHLRYLLKNLKQVRRNPCLTPFIAELEATMALIPPIIKMKQRNDLIEKQNTEREYVTATIKKLSKFRVAFDFAPNAFYPLSSTVITLKTPIAESVTFDMKTLTYDQIITMEKSRPITVTASSNTIQEMKLILKMVAESP